MLDLNHIHNYSNSTFSCFMSVFISVPLIKKHLSSAYIMANIRSDILQMSFMEIIKRREHRIEPMDYDWYTTFDNLSP